MKKLIILFVFICTVFHGSIYAQINQQVNKEQEVWVDSVYSSLSTDDKIAQLFITALYVNKGDEYIENIEKLVLDEHIGGLILMQNDITTHLNLLNEWQQKIKIPLLIGVDGEWGLAQRFDDTPKYPWAMTLGAIQNDDLIYEFATKLAKDCQRVGIHWDFTPVVDINTNPKNPIIGNRSFGSDKYNVVRKATIVMNGMQDNKILSSAKHFPGHGDTSVDSHLDLPIIKHSKERMEEIELYPFKELIKKDVKGIMVSHLNLPEYEKDPNTPASLSYSTITVLLKEQMGYKGLVITDALNMQGAAKWGKDGDVDLRAFKAGNDILLFSDATKSAKEKIKKAIESGEIPMSRLEESVKKMLEAKYWAGLNKKYTTIKTENVYKDLDKGTDYLNSRLYSEAITQINSSANFPLSKNKKYVYLDLEGIDSKYFFAELKKKNQNIKKFDRKESSKYLKNNQHIIIGIHKDTESSVYNSYQLSEESKRLLKELSDKKLPITLCVFTSPYSLNGVDIDNFENVIIAYQNNKYTHKSVVDILFGDSIAKGKLPVEFTN